MEPETNEPGQIVILNGAPRSGKSSIVEVIQETFDGPWMNLGVDTFKERVTPQRYSPGIGLRPGAESPDREKLLTIMYAAMYESIAVHSRFGLNVVTDVGHHEAYSRPLGILPDNARRLEGLPVLFVGVRCPMDVTIQRLKNTGRYAGPEHDARIKVWQHEVHAPWTYDFEVDTSLHNPQECAKLVQKRIEDGPPPSAFQKLAAKSKNKN